MIDMKNVCFDYDNGTHALHHISLRVEDGEFLFLVGQSGAGKSSLLKLITRENVATSGSVFINGYNLGKLKKYEVPYFRRTMGMIFQDFRLIQNMTVFDNVAFVLRVTNHSNKYIKARVPYVLDLVNLRDEANKYPHEMSGGEQQRVAIARALASGPPILIADEPTGNLDPALSLQIVELLFDINRYCGTTIMLVTHEHELVRHFGGRVVSIENGQIAFDEIIGGQNEGE
ncbi:MAG: ATP-binding cassette domain-containing protein [Oscillospiraceae bacterium]|nr:ATP-binding cassette domain-containing protein [Oscillospiraceae bacterium]